MVKILLFKAKLAGSYTLDPLGVKYFVKTTFPVKFLALTGVGTSIGKRKTPTSELSSIIVCGKFPSTLVPKGQLIFTSPPLENIELIAFFNSIRE